MKTLVAAYRATSYCVNLDGKLFKLRIGQPSPGLDDWLTVNGYSRWAWLTAVNPRSRQLPAEENAVRIAVLSRNLTQTGWLVYSAEAIADEGDWPPEASVFVPGMGAASALALAAEWEQHACVVGVQGKSPRLRWVR